MGQDTERTVRASLHHGNCYYSGLTLATASADNPETTQNSPAAPAPVFSRQPVKLVSHMSLPLLLFPNITVYNK